MKIAIASPPIPACIDDAMSCLGEMVKTAAENEAAIICFPESYIPGYPGMGDASEDRSPARLISVLNQAAIIARENSIAVILPMDWYGPQGFQNVAQVIASDGAFLGYQTKNQLDPSEDLRWIPGSARCIFTVNGIKFGITICHEGFRYPETVRWAAQREAVIVFHPQYSAGASGRTRLTEFGAKENPYYEKAMMMRALENTIYFAGSNYASPYTEAASSIIAPNGTCIIHEAYGKPGVIFAEIDPGLATALLAKRFKNFLYY